MTRVRMFGRHAAAVSLLGALVLPSATTAQQADPRDGLWRLTTAGSAFGASAGVLYSTSLFAACEQSWDCLLNAAIPAIVGASAGHLVGGVVGRLAPGADAANFELKAEAGVALFAPLRELGRTGDGNQGRASFRPGMGYAGRLALRPAGAPIAFRASVTVIGAELHTVDLACVGQAGCDAATGAVLRRLAGTVEWPRWAAERATVYLLGGLGITRYEIQSCSAWDERMVPGRPCTYSHAFAGERRHVSGEVGAGAEISTPIGEIWLELSDHVVRFRADRVQHDLQVTAGLRVSLF